VTEIATLAFLVASAVDDAVMLALPAPAADTRPSALTEATDALLVLHVTAWLAESWTDSPTFNAAVGAPVMITSGAGG
jgi:hypothetical protein